MSRPTLNTLAEANAYLTSAAWVALTDPQKQTALEKGARYLTIKYKYKGVLVDQAQALPFPRLALYDRENRLVTGIPQNAKDAELELALISLTEELFKNDNSGGVKSKSVTVGPITKSETYAGVKEMQTTYTIVEDLLADYLEGSSSSAGQVTIDRA